MKEWLDEQGAEVVLSRRLANPRRSPLGSTRGATVLNAFLLQFDAGRHEIARRSPI